MSGLPDSVHNYKNLLDSFTAKMAAKVTETIADATTRADSPQESNLPTVHLDNTLYDLLLQECPNGVIDEDLCHLKPNSDERYKQIPFNNKYIITSAAASSGGDLAHVQMENVSDLLMFFAGPMKVIYLASEGSSDDETLCIDVVNENAEKSFSVLNAAQRPKASTYANVEDLIQNHDGSNNRFGFACDFAERLTTLFHPEKTYLLNNKRWLAECDLASTNDTIIDPELYCETHLTQHGLWYYDSQCSEYNNGIDTEIKRLRKVLTDRPLPFVLKLTQSLGSVGTNIVQNEDERSELIDYITDYQRTWLKCLTKENAHIHPMTLVLSKFIKGETVALNFFIRRDGSPVLLGACQQLSTRGGEGGQQATTITYSDQAKLEKKYADILKDIGKVLHAEGYYGPAGADIMQDPDSGSLFVMDLNVRCATSYVLGLLRTYFEERGLGMALIYECTILTVSREDLEAKFKQAFAEGRIVILGCTKMGQKDMWAYPMVISGEDLEAINKLREQILKFEAGSQASEDAS